MTYSQSIVKYTYVLCENFAFRNYYRERRRGVATTILYPPK
jgi:hypothetical protein